MTGGTNHHVGNKRYRKMVEDRKIDYVNCKRLDKPLVALGIIREWRGQTPTGRFLKMDEKTGLWNDVGDRKAREKTSQALREKAPQIREELEKDRIARERRERGESTEEEDEEEEEVCLKIVGWCISLDPMFSANHLLTVNVISIIFYGTETPLPKIISFTLCLG